MIASYKVTHGLRLSNMDPIFKLKVKQARGWVTLLRPSIENKGEEETPFSTAEPPYATSRNTVEPSYGTPVAGVWCSSPLFWDVGSVTLSSPFFFIFFSEIRQMMALCVFLKSDSCDIFFLKTQKDVVLMCFFFKKKNLIQHRNREEPADCWFSRFSPIFDRFSGFFTGSLPRRFPSYFRPDKGPVPGLTGSTGRSGPVLTTMIFLLLATV